MTSPISARHRNEPRVSKNIASPDGPSDNDGSSGETAVRVTITGRVQGIGYRMWAQGKARGLGVLGWVRNRQDGSVEVLVQGAGDAVEAFLAASEKGPRGARVEDVMAVPEAVQELSRFEIVPDA